MIYSGDSLEVLKKFEDNSLDACVTDPPYGLSFMGKKWDYDVPSVELWREVFRVLKPGAHLLAFGGTRTYHRLVVNIEDAGFEIRDQIQWIYGQGFPKSLDISKAIDKMYGAEREVVGRNPNSRENSDTSNTLYESGTVGKTDYITKPATPDAKTWQGWGTALKPANEPIVVARKPISESTVAKNVLRWGTGALNIDGCRIGYQSEADKANAKPQGNMIGVKIYNAGNSLNHAKTENTGFEQNAQGRFPANVIFDEVAAEMLDEQSIENGIHSAGKARPKQKHVGDFGIGEHGSRERLADHRFEDTKIGASRFFYCAKASKSERNAGLEGMPRVKSTSKQQNSKGRMENGVVTNERPDEPAQQNFHPTVKPVKLMEYLVKLVTPPKGIVLDPFMGSGTTGVACKNLEKEFVGIELNPEYVTIAEKRIG